MNARALCAFVEGPSHRKGSVPLCTRFPSIICTKKCARHQEPLQYSCCLFTFENGSVLADDSDPSGYTRAGMKDLPVLLFRQNWDDQSPYWDEHFGSETLDEKILSLLNVQALVWRFLCTVKIYAKLC